MQEDRTHSMYNVSILKTVKLWIDHDGVLGNTTTGYQNAAKSFDFSCKLPSIMYDGASIIGNLCQVVAYCNQGLNGTFLLGKGYEIILNNVRLKMNMDLKILKSVDRINLSLFFFSYELLRCKRSVAAIQLFKLRTHSVQFQMYTL